MNQNKIKELEEAIVRDYGNITGIAVRKNGGLCYEQHFGGYTPDIAMHIFSVTKSVFSVLLGIALDRGCIKSVSQPVLDFFPDYEIPAGEATIQKITLEHLLTMTAPYKYDEEPYGEFFTSPDPVSAALSYLGGEKPIGRFNYSAIGGTHILSAVLTAATGRSALDFASEHLFRPLEIDVPRSIILRSEAEHSAVMNSRETKGWVSDPQGNNFASWGLFLTSADMAKIGQLFLNGGVWNGKQIVSADWVRACTSPHSRWDEIGLDYGYLWWLPDKNSFAAMGDGGNVIYANREKQLVAAISSLFMPEPRDRIELIKTLIEPLF